MNQVEIKLSKLKNKEKAKLLSGFFKTGKGDYGEGDIFWGINVPEQRKIAKEHIDSSFVELQELLSSGIHECRLTALLILTYKYEKATKGKDLKNQKMIFYFYIKNIKYINNWDLVDVTCPRIIGAYLFDKDRSLLYKLANSKNLWEKRIAIISTLYFIKQNDFSDTIKISEILLRDKHDLIHKAVGWMLREAGKMDEKVLHDFLKKHTKNMPRTALRYSIERLPEEFRRYYMTIG
jgi:3-methyladenine DNA glycosylase AlkD